MAGEFKDFIETVPSAPTPSLTLEPELDTPAEVQVIEERPAEPKEAEPVLTPQEQ